MIHTLINDVKITDKINRNADSYYINEKEIETESLNSQTIFHNYKTLYTQNFHSNTKG